MNWPFVLCIESSKLSDALRNNSKDKSKASTLGNSQIGAEDLGSQFLDIINKDEELKQSLDPDGADRIYISLLNQKYNRG